MKKIKILTSLMLCTALMVGCGNSFKRSDEYLLNNYSAITDYSPDNFDGLQLLDSEIENNDIFFTAEIHGTQSNNKLKLKFLHYFKENADVKYLLSETSYSHAYAINKYLKTGDISIIDGLYEELKGTFAWTKDGYNFLKELYQYNLTLPEEDRLIMVGVDIEHQPFNAFNCLAELLPSEAPDPLIADEIITIQDISTLAKTRDEAYELGVELKESIQENKALYEAYLGDNFFGFNFVAQNLANAKVAYDVHGKTPSKWNSTRDEFIYNNFKMIDEILPEGKYYGQWGLNHAFQSKEKDTKWFAGYLNEDPKYADRVLSIIYNYKDSNSLQLSHNHEGYGSKKMSYLYPEIKSVDKTISSKINLYKIDSEDSPFNHIKMHATDGSKLKTNCTDFFQYVLTIRNSHCSEPLE